MPTSPGGLYALFGVPYFWLLGACMLFSMGPPHCIINEAPDSVAEKSSV